MNAKKEVKEYLLKLRVPSTFSSRDLSRMLYHFFEKENSQNYDFAPRYVSIKEMKHQPVPPGEHYMTVSSIRCMPSGLVSVMLEGGPATPHSICRCSAYPYPHARGYGKCKEPRA